MFDDDNRIERNKGEPEPSKGNLLTVSMAKSSAKREVVQENKKEEEEDYDNYLDDFEDVDLEKTRVVEKPAEKSTEKPAEKPVENSMRFSDDLNFDPLSLMNSNIPNKNESEIKEEKKKEEVLPSPRKPEVSTVNIEVPSIHSVNEISRF